MGLDEMTEAGEVMSGPKLGPLSAAVVEQSGDGGMGRWRDGWVLTVAVVVERRVLAAL